MSCIFDEKVKEECPVIKRMLDQTQEINLNTLSGFCNACVFLKNYKPKREGPPVGGDTVKRKG
jgi:hypothetical protein